MHGGPFQQHPLPADDATAPNARTAENFESSTGSAIFRCGEADGPGSGGRHKLIRGGAMHCGDAAQGINRYVTLRQQMVTI
jgi:hypothetical protein